ncbi:ATP-binding cassette domain-containing protein [Dactylosporangium matsuzakiense]|uniref:ABC transporter permease n=1 Tax=Dactylosporangium matsuzakiense TaxID=53360 RepID=A0A9W6KW72_9ACTN|nr:ABC transporter ATP-binding protein [Dactylosporangium matsuzakiense]GLL07520.1 ABC transporter permease [Dactylosporangium matsuzakiense]
MTETLRGCWELLRMSWRQHPAKLILALLLKTAEAAALPLAAPALGALTDAAVAREPAAAARAAAVAAVLVMAALTLGHFAHVAYFELGEENLLAKDRELIELVTGSAGLAHQERPEYADRMQVLRQELRRTGSSSMEALLSALGTAVAVTITAVLLARLNPWLLLLPLAAVPPLLLGRAAEARLARARESAAQVSRQAQHLFDLAIDPEAGKELRVGDLSAEVRTRHAGLWRDGTSILFSAELRAAALRVAGQAVFAVGFGAATLLVVREAAAGRRTIGDAVLVIALAAQVNQQVAVAVSLLRELQRVARTLADFRWMRAVYAGQAPPPPDAAVPDRIRHGIRLRDVSFEYPWTGRPTLDGVDLFLPAGATVAVVGENGAGKTTLVKLLCRFYEPTRGRVELDGVDIVRFPLPDWRARTSAAFQDFLRPEFTARTVVGVGDLPLADSTDAVTAALHRAGTLDVVDNLDHGLDTALGASLPDGRQLSGGQWQKLALGRGMMRTAPLLLVLDEPTAALDAEAEFELFQGYAANAARVAEQTGGITVLVSHRFSTVRMADLIIVLADGRVAEAGSHDDLIARGGPYAELYQLQAAGYR